MAPQVNAHLMFPLFTHDCRLIVEVFGQLSHNKGNESRSNNGTFPPGVAVKLVDSAASSSNYDRLQVRTQQIISLKSNPSICHHSQCRNERVCLLADER